MLAHDAEPAGPGRTRSGDVLLSQDSLRDDTGEPGDDRGHREPDRHRDRDERRPLHCHDQHGEQQHGKGDQDVHRRRTSCRPPSRRQSRGREPDGHADGGAHPDGPDASHQGDARADHDLREQVAAQPVRARASGRPWAFKAARPWCRLDRTAARRRTGRDQHDRPDQDESDDQDQRPAVARTRVLRHRTVPAGLGRRRRPIRARHAAPALWRRRGSTRRCAMSAMKPIDQHGQGAHEEDPLDVRVVVLRDRLEQHAARGRGARRPPR